MRVTFCEHTALAITRSLRSRDPTTSALTDPRARTDLEPFDISPRKRLTKSVFDSASLHIGNPFAAARPTRIAVTDVTSRLHSQYATSRLYVSGLPERSFVRIGNGVAISCPELLFVEMSCEMSPIQHLMLGHELCGGFSRSADDPRSGDVKYGCRPVTSVNAIRSFIEQTKHVRGLKEAHRTLDILEDGAWSPMESLVAAFMRLPLDNFGYNMGALRLNQRIFTPRELLATAEKESRVPDILLVGTSVGINYDGMAHLDLAAIAKSALKAGVENSEDPSTEAHRELARTMRSVRKKAVDDVRRNRELAADGLTVFPITKEDLREKGGFDRVIHQVLESIERTSDLDMTQTRKALADRNLCDMRQQLIWALLPDRCEPRYPASKLTIRNPESGELEIVYVAVVAI